MTSAKYLGIKAARTAYRLTARVFIPGLPFPGHPGFPAFLIPGFPGNKTPSFPEKSGNGT